MGPHCSDLINAIERAFGFAIPDEEAAGFETVGELYEWVLAHRLSEKRDSCLYSMTFYKVRQALMSSIHAAREAIQPKTLVGDLLTIYHRGRTLREMQRTTQYRMPELYRPPWVLYAAACLTAVLSIAAPMVLHFRLGHGAIGSVLVTAFVFGYLLTWLTKPLTYAIPPEYATVELFVRGVMARNYWTIVREAEQHGDADEAWCVLREIAAKCLGVPPAYIAKETALTPGKQIAAKVE